MNFELDCFNIGFINFINFFGFYKIESLIIVAMTIFGAEAIRNVLNDESIVYAIRSGWRKGGKRRTICLFVVIIVVELNDIYFIRFLMLFLFIFTLWFIVTMFFSIVVIFVFFIVIFFVWTVFGKIYITFKIVTFITTFVILFESLRLYRIIPSILFVSRLYLNIFSFSDIIFNKDYNQCFRFFGIIYKVI